MAECVSNFDLGDVAVVPSHPHVDPTLDEHSGQLPHLVVDHWDGRAPAPENLSGALGVAETFDAAVVRVLALDESVNCSNRGHGLEVRRGRFAVEYHFVCSLVSQPAVGTAPPFSVDASPVDPRRVAYDVEVTAVPRVMWPVEVGRPFVFFHQEMERPRVVDTQVLGEKRRILSDAVCVLDTVVVGLVLVDLVGQGPH